MSAVDAGRPVTPLWVISQILAAMFWIGTILSIGILPLVLLGIALQLWVYWKLFQGLRWIVRTLGRSFKRASAARRASRLKEAMAQSSGLVQLAPRIAAATDFGQIHGLLSPVPGLDDGTLRKLKALNRGERQLLEAMHGLLRADPRFAAFPQAVATTQATCAQFLKQLAKPPALPGPELAGSWLPFHEEIRMSVQEINNALALLQDKATDIAALEMRLNEEIAAAATPALPAPVEYGPLPLDRLIQDMAGQLSAMDSKTPSGTFRELFELSQAIDSAFAAAGREPPAKTGLVSGEVRRVHQLEAFLSVYREKLSTLDQQHKAGEIDDSSYAVMKSAWERTLESELAAIEGVE